MDLFLQKAKEFDYTIVYQFKKKIFLHSLGSK